jgi:hypothetical protein
VQKKISTQKKNTIIVKKNICNIFIYLWYYYFCLYLNVQMMMIMMIFVFTITILNLFGSTMWWCTADSILIFQHYLQPTSSPSSLPHFSASRCFSTSSGDGKKGLPKDATKFTVLLFIRICFLITYICIHLHIIRRRRRWCATA